MSRRSGRRTTVPIHLRDGLDLPQNERNVRRRVNSSRQRRQISQSQPTTGVDLPGQEETNDRVSETGIRVVTQTQTQMQTQQRREGEASGDGTDGAAMQNEFRGGDVNSIRDTARNQSESNGQYGNTYGLPFMVVDRSRICYCDQPFLPDDCVRCREGVCENHETVTCTYPLCDVRWHKLCFQKRSGNVTDDFRCIQHMNKPQPGFRHLPWRSISNERKALRWGTEYDYSVTPRTNQVRWKTLQTRLKDECNVPENILDSIKNHDALPFPEITSMAEIEKERHARCGRKFEISMLQFCTKTCDCCGRTEPMHLDPDCSGAKKEPEKPLERTSFTGRFHDAVECSCMDFCKGQQFFCEKRPNEMEVYNANHRGRNYEHLKKRVRLCKGCYDENHNKKKSRENNSVLEMLRTGRMFSVRNGFGGPTVPIAPAAIPPDEMQILVALRLKVLFQECTAAEEAAVRQIAVLQSFMVLKEGNLGVKGNTYMVWQKSKLNIILPNLPVDCTYIVIRHDQNRGPNGPNLRNIKQTKFKKSRIAEILQLLSTTVEGVWKPTDEFGITISAANLGQWPDEGDLLEMNRDLHIFEVTDDGTITERQTTERTEGNLDADNDNEGRVQDGNDMGPAPLQNPEAEDETYHIAIGGEQVPGIAGVATAMNTAVDRLVDNTAVEEGAPLPGAETGGNEATFNQSDVLKTDGFVDMDKTPYAWARAFPSIFIPEYMYMPQKNAWGWCVRMDITGWNAMREKQVDLKRWCKQLMWQYDGAPAAHPTFSLALMNYMTSKKLQKQGRYAVNTSDMDLDAEIENIRTDDAQQELLKKLVDKAHCFTTNVPGTPKYWRSTMYEFQATQEFNSEVLGSEAGFFLTNSLADHHDYHLRLLLHNYVTVIRKHGRVPEGLEEILTDDRAFSKAAQIYKAVVTHFFVTKIEVWFSTFLLPLFGIALVLLVYEFQTGRGVIHSHAVGSAVRETNSESKSDEIVSILHTLAWSLHNLIEGLDENLSGDFAVAPDVLKKIQNDHVNGLDKRKEIFQTTELGSVRWGKFLADRKELESKSAIDLGDIFEGKWGYSSLHHGSFPTDWVKPGGLPYEGYRSSTAGMTTSKEILEKKELKKLKCTRENDLHSRRANMENHCGTHRCSGYCLKEKKVTEKFSPTNVMHVEIVEATPAALSSDYITYVLCSKCKMMNTELLKFDQSGENNKTGGIPYNADPSITFDKNQVVRWHGRRNHPRILDQPHAAKYFGANVDMQPLLINGTFKETLEKCDKDMEKYQRFMTNLRALGCGGLEYHSGRNTILNYLTSYSCKGGVSTEEYNVMAAAVTEAYLARDDNSNKTIKSVVAKHMNEIQRNTSKTRDECQFILAGGHYKRNSVGAIRTCSVNSVNVDDIGTTTAGSEKAFTWKNIQRYYKNRGTDGGMDAMDLYTFCATRWPPEEGISKPVNFYGYDNRASWPLEENYSKWALTLYYPWYGNVESLLVGRDDDSFAGFLAENLMTGHFKNDAVRFEIARRKCNVARVDVEENPYATEGGVNGTPTRDRTDERMGEAAAAGLANGDFNNDDWREEHEEYFDENDLRRLPDPSEDVDWTTSVIEDVVYDGDYGKVWLEEKKEIFYQRRDENTAWGNTDENEDTVVLELFQEEIYRPEGAHDGKQKLLVCMVLYQLYRFENYESDLKRWGQDNDELPTGEQTQKPKPPSCFHVYVEGKPGTGKTFVLKTARNMVRVVKNSNHAELSSAPTGCASAIIQASTHCRTDKIPTGDAFENAPSNLEGSICNKMLAVRRSHSAAFFRGLDEHSMAGRKYFAWLKHRNTEFRTPTVVCDDGGNMIDNREGNVEIPIPPGRLSARQRERIRLDKRMKDVCHVDPQLVQRPWAGIPLVLTMGDQAQLPPVKDKVVYDTSASRKQNSSDACGRVAFHEFLNPPNKDEVESFVIIMDEVVRQDDEEFKALLGRMTDGKMTNADVDWMASKCLCNLESEEKKLFDGAIHLVRKWEDAKPIVFEYLDSMSREQNVPLAKFKAKFETTRTDGINCCLKKCSYPKINAFCVGAIVMLLKNFIVEGWKIFNGSVGIVRDIIYDSPDGGRTGELPAFIVVEFPEAGVPEGDKFNGRLPRNFVAIPVVTERCGNRCKRCTVQTVPLRVAVALSIYKSQGMTIGPLGLIFTRAVVHAPEAGAKNVQGQLLVAASRVTGPEYLAFGNNPNEGLSREDLLNVGKSPADQRRRLFMATLEERAERSEDELKSRISDLDADSPTYEGGCAFLIEWYRSLQAD